MKKRLTFRASRSLSRLCPIRMDSALNMESSTAWTSLRVMAALSRSSAVTPENLWVTHEIKIRPEITVGLVKQQKPADILSQDSPRVVVHHFAFRFHKRVVDDFHLWVDDRHPGQLQTLLCVTLFPQVREKWINDKKQHHFYTRDSLWNKDFI